MPHESFLRTKRVTRVFPMFGTLLVLFFQTLETAVAVEKPNILYILADDLGYGDVQVLNPERGRIATPNMDRLATESMVFTDMHAGSSVCTPTRYGILTGRYAWRTCLQKGVLHGEGSPLIAADRLSVPKLLREHGYRTAGMGKWHLGLDAPLKDGHFQVDEPIRNGPTTRGFDTYFCSDLRFFAPFMFVEDDRFIGTPLFERTEVGAKYGRGTPLTQDDFAHILPAVTDRAVAYLEARKGEKEPFFLYFAPCAPHDPFVPTAEWKGKSGLGVYADYVMETDAEIGRVLSALEESGRADETLVIFTSDNGCAPYAGVKKMEAKGHYPSADRRGYKSDIWDGGHRIPFIARWPGKVTAGSTCDDLYCLTDLLATCANLLEVDLPDHAGEDSVSLLPALLGQGSGVVRDSVVHHSMEGMFAIRQGKWKLVCCPGSGGWGPPKDAAAKKKGLPAAQLYDMTADSGERRNLQAERPEVVERLKNLLDRYVAEGRSTSGVPQTNDVAVTVWKMGRELAGP